MDVLNLEHLSVSYRGGREAVSDLSMTVKEQQIICIVGESGSGKSTLLHAILGMLPGTASVQYEKMTLLGQNFGTAVHPERRRGSRGLREREAALRRMRGRDAAMIFQDAGRYMNPTARIGTQYREFLKSHEKISERACVMRAKEMLSDMGLQDPERVLHAYPFELSGGMCQRVAIAMAMTLRPKLLFADEPTSALDVTIQAQVVRQIAKLREEYGTAIVMVTHNMGVAAWLSDYIGVLQQGKLVEWQQVKELISHPQHPYTKSLLDAVPELDDERLKTD